MRRIGLLTVSIIFILAGCVTTVSTDVNRFTSPNLPQDLTGKTFVFVKLDKQEGSVEYDTHAALISEYLEKLGWRRTEDMRGADYAVSFFYGQGNGQTVSREIPIYGQTGGGTSYTSGTVNAYGGSGYRYGSYSGTTYTPPTYGVVGSTTQTETTYARFLDVAIYDWQKSIHGNKLVGVWEGKANSTGSSSTFAAVSKCMIKAVFSDFRKSGTENVQIPRPEC
ncbi:DUF4136 domain-containing protein [Ferrovibrio sp.]|uniref:DUF4136 domain-containing protein n=1 Tax=Ferrovibrio sp. TaxID=1917215 RepID=UPI0035174487